MKADIRKIRKLRRYSEEFKKDIVQLFEQGKFSVCQMERLYGVSNGTIYQWIYKYSTFNEKGYRIIEMKKSQTNKVKQLEQRIKELERLVGRKQIEIDYLETMMEVAKEELDIDIKKNFGTPRLEKPESRKKKGDTR